MAPSRRASHATRPDELFASHSMTAAQQLHFVPAGLLFRSLQHVQWLAAHATKRPGKCSRHATYRAYIDGLTRAPSPRHMAPSVLRCSPPEMSYLPFSHHAAAVAATNTVPPRRGYSVRGAGPAVLLLHASLGSKAQWRALTERLSSRFRVIAVDLWGYGDNADWPAPTPFSVDDEVQVVVECLDRLVPLREALHVVGHSYGGLDALRLAATKLRRLAR